MILNPSLRKFKLEKIFDKEFLNKILNQLIQNFEK